MLAVKRGNAATARIILEFGIDPAILLLRDADGSTPLHVAVQKADTLLAELLLKHGPTQLYTENSVGQTPLDVASLKGLPRVTSPTWLTARVLPTKVDADAPLRPAQMQRPFDVEKQKTEIPKLRATLDTLLADGLIVHGTNLATGLLAFASRMEERLVVETARKNATMKQTKEAEVDSLRVVPQDATAGTYFALCDAVAARPGTRQLVHLADVQRSVQWNLAQQAEGTFVKWSQRARATEVEPTEPDPEDQRIAQLRARSLFAQRPLSVYNTNMVNLYGEDRL
jgi:Ankyrin repeats (3 copies)